MRITLELDTDTLTPEQLTAVGMLIPSPFDRKNYESVEAGSCPPPVIVGKPKTIKRADVRLKAGDRVVTRDGEELTVEEEDEGEKFIGTYPSMMSNGVAYMRNGYCYSDKNDHPRDITTVNGTQIED